MRTNNNVSRETFIDKQNTVHRAYAFVELCFFMVIHRKNVVEFS